MAHTVYENTAFPRIPPPPYGNPDLDGILISLGVSHKAQAAPREPGVADSREANGSVVCPAQEFQPVLVTGASFLKPAADAGRRQEVGRLSAGKDSLCHLQELWGTRIVAVYVCEAARPLPCRSKKSPPPDGPTSGWETPER